MCALQFEINSQIITVYRCMLVLLLYCVTSSLWMAGKSDSVWWYLQCVQFAMQRCFLIFIYSVAQKPDH